MISFTSVQLLTSKNSTMPWLSCRTGRKRKCLSSNTWTKKAIKILKCTRQCLNLHLMSHLSTKETSAAVRMFLLTTMLSKASWNMPSQLSNHCNKRSTWRTLKMTILKWDVRTNSLERDSLYSRVRTLPTMSLLNLRWAALDGLLRTSAHSAAIREIFGKSREQLSQVMFIGKTCKLVPLIDYADGYSLHLSPSFWFYAPLQLSHLPSNIKKVSVMESTKLNSIQVPKLSKSTSMNIKQWQCPMELLLVLLLSIRLLHWS